MRIEVTAEDIAAAEAWRKERDARIAREGLHSVAHTGPAGDITMNCPVARAARRSFADLERVEATTLMFADHCLDLPPQAEERINKWDTGEGMEPFSFEVPE